MLKGKILKFEKSSFQVGFSGVKGKVGYSNRPLFNGYFNGAGAFMQYPTQQLLVHWETADGKKQSMDIRDYVKNNMKQSRITQKFIDSLNKLNVGREVELTRNASTRKNEIKDLDQLIIP